MTIGEGVSILVFGGVISMITAVTTYNKAKDESFLDVELLKDEKSFLEDKVRRLENREYELQINISAWEEVGKELKLETFRLKTDNDSLKRKLGQLARDKHSTIESLRDLTKEENDLVVKALKGEMFKTHPDRSKTNDTADEFMKVNALYQKLKSKRR